MFRPAFGATPLKLESLEGRDVPAADVFLDGPSLVITADGEHDTVLVSEAGGALFLNINGVEFEPLPRDAVQFIEFAGGGGDDIFVNATSAFAIAYGESGNDILVGGNFGNALIGGRGDDILIGGVSDDFLIGENGRDLLFGGPGVDVLMGGNGQDQILDFDPFDAFDDSDSDFFGNDFDDFDDDFDD